MRENGSINPTSLTKWNVSLPKISVWPNACFCLYFIVYIVPKKNIFLMIIYLFYFEPQRNLKVALLAGIVADWCMIRLIITPKIHFFFLFATEAYLSAISDFFDLCLHWLSVVRGKGHPRYPNSFWQLRS